MGCITPNGVKSYGVGWKIVVRAVPPGKTVNSCTSDEVRPNPGDTDAIVW